MQIANNIVSAVTDPQGNHVFIEDGTTASASSLGTTLMDGTVRIRWGSGQVYSLAGFQTAFPGKGVGALNADPRFVNPATSDYRLQVGSPAVDAGITASVYATFQTLYGLDIAKDLAGTTRPQGPAYDIGAYEFAASGVGLSSPSQLQVK